MNPKNSKWNIDDEQGIVISVPINRVKHGTRRILQVGGNRSKRQTNYYLAPLLELARARNWMRMLESGKVKSLGEITEIMGIDGGCIRRTMRLLNLSAKVVNTLVENRNTKNITLNNMYEIKTLDWRKQEIKLGL